MKIQIPTVNDIIRLTEEWETAIFFVSSYDNANDAVIATMRPEIKELALGSSVLVKFPAGTIFKIKRLYIRAGSTAAFNSLTLLAYHIPGIAEQELTSKPFALAKFWVKIPEANNIVFESLDAIPLPEKPRKSKRKAS